MIFEDPTQEASQEFTITSQSGSNVQDVRRPKPSLVQTVEDFRSENKKSIEIIKATTQAIKNSVIFPDLWNEHNKNLDSDVFSKEDCLQVPRHLRFITSLESAYENQKNQEFKKDTN